MRLQAERCRIERMPGAAEAALHFVGDQQRAGVAARLVDRRGKLRRERADAAFALDRLGDDRGGVARDRRAAAPRIVDRHEA